MPTPRPLKIEYLRFASLLKELMQNRPNEQGDLYLLACRRYFNDPEFEFQPGERNELKTQFYVVLYSNSAPFRRWKL